MDWYVTEGGGEARSVCGRFVVYAIPEGYVALDRAAGPAAGLSDPFPTLDGAQGWAAGRAKEGCAA